MEETGPKENRAGAGGGGYQQMLGRVEGSSTKYCPTRMGCSNWKGGQASSLNTVVISQEGHPHHYHHQMAFTLLNHLLLTGCWTVKHCPRGQGRKSPCSVEDGVGTCWPWKRGWRGHCTQALPSICTVTWTRERAEDSVHSGGPTAIILKCIWLHLNQHHNDTVK